MDPAIGAASPRTDTNTGVAPAPGGGRVRRRTGWWLPTSLLALAVIPILGATGRLVEMLGGPDVLPTDARFAASPVPLAVHSVAAIGYVVLGAFQFSAGIRRRHRGWHRRAGRVLVALGLAIAFSGLWMTLLYPRKEGTGDILWAVRLLASSGMGISIILAFAAIRRRNIARHRAWMTRGYALALGAGTQAFTVGFGEAAFGSGVVRTDLMMTAGWAINLAVAEWIIRRPVARRARSTRTMQRSSRGDDSTSRPHAPATNSGSGSHNVRKPPDTGAAHETHHRHVVARRHHPRPADGRR